MCNKCTSKCYGRLRRFLGLTTYLGNFIPSLSQKTLALRELLRKNIEWHWLDIQEKAFIELKEYLTKRPVLNYYSMKERIVISVDASRAGAGCGSLTE